MRRALLVASVVSALALGVLPASANRDVTTMLVQAGDRFVPLAPGETRDYTFVFGPFVVPAGQDSNRYSLDVPFSNGFIVAVAPDLIDAKNGTVPTEQDAHIHHAHWLRVTRDSTHEYYSEDLLLSWVFGTGEEKTQGRLDDRARVERLYGGPEAANREYGIYIDGQTPQLLIYMIHNKTAAPLEVYVVLDVTFVHGTQTQLARLGRDMHPLDGTLWGETKDATALYPALWRSYTATADGVAVASGGHTHPGGKVVIVTNQGPAGSGCDADSDGDGFPGVTILRSWKYDRIQASWPFSEDYQMGATKFGWRAPIRKGDRIVQIAPHAVHPTGVPTDLNYVSPDGFPHAHYQSMTYTGIYMDRLQKPAPITGGICNPANYLPTLIGADTFDVQGRSVSFASASVAAVDALATRFLTGAAEGMLNHIWQGDLPDPHCGNFAGSVRSNCEVSSDPAWSTLRVDTDVVHTGAFVYAPGDLLAGAPLARVKAGTPITFVNEDAALNIRHTITSCPAPCNGPYRANYPVPDGVFDSGKLGNFDPIDGGLFTTVNHGQAGPDDYMRSDTIPFWTWTPPALTGNVQSKIYTYYCRIHPWMRGAFEVVA